MQLAGYLSSDGGNNSVWICVGLHLLRGESVPEVSGRPLDANAFVSVRTSRGHRVSDAILLSADLYLDFRHTSMLRPGSIDTLHTHQHGKNEETHDFDKLAVPASQEQPEQDSNSSSSTRRGSLCSADIKSKQPLTSKCTKNWYSNQEEKKWSEHKS